MAIIEKEAVDVLINFTERHPVLGTLFFTSLFLLTILGILWKLGIKVGTKSNETLCKYDPEKINLIFETLDRIVNLTNDLKQRITQMDSELKNLAVEIQSIDKMRDKELEYAYRELKNIIELLTKLQMQIMTLSIKLDQDDNDKYLR